MLYTNLLTSGKLNSHLAEKEDVTEKLKAENQMEWVGIMGNIESRCREIVNNEMMFI